MDLRVAPSARYVPLSPDPSAHFRIVLGKTVHAFETLPCLLARAWPDGRFELLTPAWDALGYSAAELRGRCVCDLVALERHAACAALRVVLSEGGSLELGLRRKCGGEAVYCWSRQFDDYTGSIFIVGDERLAPRRAMTAPRPAPVGALARPPVLDKA
ncbi:MAG TPA: hypothetical protein VNH80_04395 [Burkholderiales bacterium]|nr:hypothetical protein [Burkholderiales bacterium]